MSLSQSKSEREHLKFQTNILSASNLGFLRNSEMK